MKADRGWPWARGGRRPRAVRAMALGLAAWLAAASATASESQGERIHEVQPGETLWEIAASTVGDATLWPALYLANRDRIKDPARVYPGQRLAIPQIEPGSQEALRREASSLTRRGAGRRH